MSDRALFVMARIEPNPEHLVDALSAIQAIVESTRAEPGCRQFVLHEGRDDGCLYLYEEWDNEASLAEHYEQPYTKAVFESYRQWLAKPVSVAKMLRVV